MTEDSLPEAFSLNETRIQRSPSLLLGEFYGIVENLVEELSSQEALVLLLNSMVLTQSQIDTIPPAMIEAGSSPLS